MSIDGVVEVGGHKTFYREDGPKDGPLMVFVHGWPELSYSWRHQLPAMARLGFHAVAPDLRGYGQSLKYVSHADFAQEKVVADMLSLADALGSDSAVWVGHDWGSPTVWNIASHHPDRCRDIVGKRLNKVLFELSLPAVTPAGLHLIPALQDDLGGLGEFHRTRSRAHASPPSSAAAPLSALSPSFSSLAAGPALPSPSGAMRV